MALVIIHRDFEGEHETDGDWCWCQPVLVDPDVSLKDGDEIVAEMNEHLDG